MSQTSERPDAPACGFDRLDVLLHGDESSQAFDLSARHVEQCPACQQRLEQMAADAEGHADNIKITRPDDLELAAFFLRGES